MKKTNKQIASEIRKNIHNDIDLCIDKYSKSTGMKPELKPNILDFIRLLDDGELINIFTKEKLLALSLVKSCIDCNHNDIAIQYMICRIWWMMDEQKLIK